MHFMKNVLRKGCFIAGGGTRPLGVLIGQISSGCFRREMSTSDFANGAGSMYGNFAVEVALCA